MIKKAQVRKLEKYKGSIKPKNTKQIRNEDETFNIHRMEATILLIKYLISYNYILGLKT